MKADLVRAALHERNAAVGIGQLLALSRGHLRAVITGGMRVELPAMMCARSTDLALVLQIDLVANKHPAISQHARAQQSAATHQSRHNRSMDSAHGRGFVLVDHQNSLAEGCNLLKALSRGAAVDQDEGAPVAHPLRTTATPKKASTKDDAQRCVCRRRIALEGMTSGAWPLAWYLIAQRTAQHNRQTRAE